MSQPIHHTFGPHCTAAYCRKALWLLLTPWRVNNKKERKQLRELLRKWFDADPTLFATGRDALLALLRSLELEAGSEIIIQGFTCVALPNAIHAAGFSPIFVDANPETLNIDLSKLEGKITHRTRAVICQHTFGIVADTRALRTLANKHDLILIEDCAHILPDVTGPKSIGKYADFLMLSFGRDKALSGISGGAILSKHDAVSSRLNAEEHRAKEPGLLTVQRLLLYPLLYAIAKPLYGIVIGKALLWLTGKLRLLSPVITQKEKRGFVSVQLHRMPNACCSLVRNEFTRMHSINNHRRTLVALYAEAAAQHKWRVPSGVSMDLPLQKFPLLVPDGDALRLQLKQDNIYLDDGWTGASVCPRSVSQEAAGYRDGSCPNAEVLAQKILSLPTHPTMTLKQAEALIKIIQEEL